VLFGLEPEQLGMTLNDYLWARCGIEEAAIDVGLRLRGPEGQAALVGPGALFLVPGSMRAADIARIVREGYDIERMNAGFQALGEALELDWLVIDTHPGLNEATLLSIAIADVLFLLLRPDRQDYQGTAITLDVARRLEVPRLELLVNKVLASVDFTAVREGIEAGFAATVAAVLPLSEDLLRNGSETVLVAANPEHPVSRVINELASGL
jgi:MinD-like ATPase involved in chromosome partitioning or flagellar assembly